MKQFWQWSKDEVTSNRSELIIEGVVASESWYGDEVTPKQFREELNAHNGDLTVRINSPGGDVYAGVSIYNALTEYEGTVTVKVDGMAASIASVVAMAGDEIQMLPGSQMMVHRPWTLAMGNADDLEEVISYLKKVGENITTIYTERTGLSAERVTELLDAETWLNPEEAVSLGFADKVIQPKQKAVSNLLDEMKESVKAAVLQPAMSLKTKLGAPTGDAEAEPTKEVDDVTTPTEEPIPIPEPTVLPDVKQEEESTETEEVVDTPVEETNQSTNEENEMAEQAEIAQAQVITPENQATVEVKSSPKNYLKTKASLEDFANVLQANAGATAEAVKNAWKGELAKNGLADPEFFALPEPIVTSIEDAVKASGIYSMLNHTGLDVFRVVWDDTDSNIDASRAGGHTKGDTKTEQVLDFDARVIRAQYIYKYLVLNKEDIRENRSSGALMRFVLNELPVRIIREIERAVVIGDGRAVDADRKITSFVSIKSDVEAGNTFAAEYVPAVGESRAESARRAMDLILAEGNVVMIAKKGFATDALFERDADGKLLFPLGASAGTVLGVNQIIEPTWFNDATDADYDAYLVVPSAYATVGDSSIESFTNFALATNKNEFLQEIYKGGALAARKAAVGIAPAPVA